MEALLEPEKVHRVLSLRGSPGLSDSAGGGGADGFLAHFLLSLVQPFDSLSMEKKVLLLSELLRKDDVINNTFNLFRMFAAIYGPSEAPKMLVRLRKNMRASQRNWILASQGVTGKDVGKLRRKVEKYQAMHMTYGMTNFKFRASSNRSAMNIASLNRNPIRLEPK